MQWKGEAEQQMRLDFPKLIPAVFISRLHRFGAQVDLNGERVLAHVASSGRMRELLLPGATVWVEELQGRKSRCRLWLVEKDSELVCVHALAPNYLVKNLLEKGFWPQRFDGGQRALEAPIHYEMYSEIFPEARYKDSRFDFRLQGEGGECFLEVKSVTLVEDGVALFPDAPTARGTRHLKELIDLKLSGKRAMVLMMVQRSDAAVFRPNEKTDPEFASAMRHAVQSGVEVYALTCRVDPAGMEVEQEIPVEL